MAKHYMTRVASKTPPRTRHRFMREDPDLRREMVKDVIITTKLRLLNWERLMYDVDRFESLGFSKAKLYLSFSESRISMLTTFSDWCSSASKLLWTKCCSDIRGPNCRRTAEINIAVRLPYSIFVYFFWSDTCISNDALNRSPSPLLQPCVRITLYVNLKLHPFWTDLLSIFFSFVDVTYSSASFTSGRPL